MFYTVKLKTAQLLILVVLVFLNPISGICEVPITAWGQGTASCGLFVQARRTAQDSAYKDWLGGFLTATSWLTNTENIAGKTDLASLMLWIENYCNKNPLKSFGVAAANLIIRVSKSGR